MLFNLPTAFCISWLLKIWTLSEQVTGQSILDAIRVDNRWSYFNQVTIISHAAQTALVYAGDVYNPVIHLEKSGKIATHISCLWVVKHLREILSNIWGRCVLNSMALLLVNENLLFVHVSELDKKESKTYWKAQGQAYWIFQKYYNWIHECTQNSWIKPGEVISLNIFQDSTETFSTVSSSLKNRFQKLPQNSVLWNFDSSSPFSPYVQYICVQETMSQNFLYIH